VLCVLAWREAGRYVHACSKRKLLLNNHKQIPDKDTQRFLIFKFYGIDYWWVERIDITVSDIAGKLLKRQISTFD
jgi:hypothetical protein